MASEGQDRADALGWGRGFTPTDLRPSPANRTIPHKSYRCFYLRQKAKIVHGLIQDTAHGLRRIFLPRTRVNRARCPDVRCRRGSLVWASPSRVKQSKETTKSLRQ